MDHTTVEGLEGHEGLTSKAAQVLLSGTQQLEIFYSCRLRQQH